MMQPLEGKTMKPSIKLIGGIHMTATDKRRAIECLEYLSTRQELADNHPWLGVKRGKEYSITSHPDGRETEYVLCIRETYKTDFGATRKSTTTVIIKVSGMACPHIKPLQEAA